MFCLKALSRLPFIDVAVTNTPLKTTAWFTPLGWAAVVHDDRYIYQLTFENPRQHDKHLNHHTLRFEGLAPQGTTFQKKVWHVLHHKGKSTALMCYQDIARALGAPRSARAVGQAVGRNPIAYLIPCHKVIRKDGALGGFAWGQDLKQRMQAYDQQAA